MTYKIFENGHFNNKFKFDVEGNSTIIEPQLSTVRD